MFAEERLRAEDGGVDFALVGSNWGGRMGASGLHEYRSELTACSPSQEPVRPPWHGRGQGFEFESPKLHQLTCVALIPSARRFAIGF
jgi:hypothetical protein